MTESSGYTHFHYHTRYWLSMLLQDHYTYRAIGKIIGKHHTTISREVEQNGITIHGKLYYDHDIAEAKAKERWHRSKGPKILRDKRLLKYIEALLMGTWSPDAIAGHLRKHRKQWYVSHESIYKFIYRYQRSWIQFLARQHGKRHSRAGKYTNRKKVIIPGRVTIDKRPKGIEKRNTFGHFEADTIISRQSKVSILVLLERKTRQVKLRKLNRKTAAHVTLGIQRLLGHYKDIVKTITYDNGTENACHEKTNRYLHCRSYFCNPYHSWERGSVENVIGLVRRFLPKGTDFSKLSERKLREIENIINRRPRKLLQYQTPHELFQAEWCTYR
jgi:IS30 family transposase